jgi:hypothetical protein
MIKRNSRLEEKLDSNIVFSAAVRIFRNGVAFRAAAFNLRNVADESTIR